MKTSFTVGKATMTAAAVLALLTPNANAFYMAGVKAKSFEKGAEIPLKVNALTSIHTQIPRPYYRMPYCEPAEGKKRSSESFGEFLTGNKVMNSPYTINMKNDVYCQRICQVTPTDDEVKTMQMHIGYQYHNNWIVDNLPSASFNSELKGHSQKHYAGGFPVGFIDEDSKVEGKKPDFYIYNHVRLMLEYHTPDKAKDEHRVVGFYVEPMSVAHKFMGGFEWDGVSDASTKHLSTCTSGKHLKKDDIRQNQIVEKDSKIIYTYDVVWTYSDKAWASRWDVYLSEDGEVPAQVHWYSITNSILVMLFLSLLVVSILVRNLRRDIAGYNGDLTDEEKEEEVDESGWKLIHADVFRPPQNYPMFYSVFIGTGLQIGISSLFSILFSAFGFLNPSRRGSLMTAILVLFVLCGSLAGYVSSRLYKTFNGKSWQTCTIVTAAGFPGFCFAVFLFFNTVLSFFHSSGAVPFFDVILVGFLWCFVSMPLVFFGAFVGYKQSALTYPTVTSSIARAIPPPSSIVLNPTVAIIFTGVVPFAAAYVELFFIMTSLWMDQFYYVFGFTFVVFLILLITCAEMTVLMVYYQLCAENHRWWWMSFLTGGSVAFYMFLYSVFWFSALDASSIWITYLLYFGYMFLLSMAMFLVTGTVGALTSLWFIRKIFSTIKVD
jgi:transmembrane 9 superfamily protein 2/4